MSYPEDVPNVLAEECVPNPGICVHCRSFAMYNQISSSPSPPPIPKGWGGGLVCIHIYIPTVNTCFCHTKIDMGV